MSESFAGEAVRAPRVTCVLVNWNGWADTVACMESLATQTYAALDVIVVENGSTNNSLERIRAAAGPGVRVIETGRNLGYAGGCNVGIRAAMASGAELVWLLNNDTVAPADTCSKLVRAALAHPAAGLIGSVLFYMHAPTQVQAWGGGNVDVRLGLTTHFTEKTELGPRTYFTFASVLVRRAVFERVGVLFEGFFMYWDDSDFMLRARRAGFGLAMAEDTAILHKEGGSAEPKSPTIDRFSTTAGMRFLKRNAPRPWASMIWFVAMKLGNRLLHGRWKNVRAVCLAVGDFWRERRISFSDQL